ncbi:Conserved_hypothetical protein [Hexamita inflata]|uniref:Uncharacterized protein n=1 Tax=Hexamita inflata TaxID=28002 RepID=A0AA86RKU2_9EUKA|nr:Conserved hypothetical protein [Hexamita inflata]
MQIQTNWKTPQNSIKYSDFLQMLNININLPKCPERLIIVEQLENKLVISTPKFSVKWRIEYDFPADITVVKGTLNQSFNGNLLRISYKAHKIGEEIRKREFPVKNAPEKKERAPKQQREEAQEEAAPAQEDPVQKEQRIMTKAEKLLQVSTAPKAPLVVSKERKTNNQVNHKQTRTISNILTEKRVGSEQELLLKIAKKAQKQQQDRESGKVEAIEKKEQFVMQQIEAKQKRRDERESKKKAIVKRIKDKQGK